jgi:hypothetical protein
MTCRILTARIRVLECWNPDGMLPATPRYSKTPILRHSDGRERDGGTGKLVFGRALGRGVESGPDARPARIVAPASRASAAAAKGPGTREGQGLF